MKSFGIQFSGGKDSLAALYMMRPFFGDAVAYLANAPSLYPHVTAFARRTCSKLGIELVEIAPPIPLRDFHAQAGLPSDIVPVDATREMAPFIKRDGVRLQSTLSCCWTMLWAPLHQRMRDDGVKFVVRGSKACDERVGAPDGTIDEAGVVYLSPCWNWSDAQVFAYLREQGAELPDHYAEAPASFDCALCTGYLNDRGAAAKLAWTREHCPDIWPELNERLHAVRDCVAAETARVEAAFGERR